MATDASTCASSSRAGFVHLHLHSEYSLLDGGNRIDRLIARVKELGMDAVAVTDHGNLHGAVSFYTKAKAAGIKPILGIEAYVAPDGDGRVSDRTDKTFKGVADGGFHLVLLAENQTGWKHLLKLSSDAFLTGYYFKPRMDKTTLTQWADGLIAINGHLGSSLAFHLTRYEQTKDEKHYQNALAEAKWHAEVFKPNGKGEPRFYIEIQRHETADQDAINPHLIRLAKELNLPLVCDNDAHFLLKEDYDAHDVLCCISMGKTRDEPNRLRYPRELYVKSPDQMAKLFGDLPEAVENTRRIADRCEVELDFSANHAPVVKIVLSGGPLAQQVNDAQLPLDPDIAQKLIRGCDVGHPLGSTEWFKAFCAQFELQPFDSEKDNVSAEDLKRQCDGALRMLTEAGAIWRYGPDGITDAIRARLERELQVLADKLISAYFLIVWDFVNESRRRGIPCNARGSGVGTMVGFCLGLSNACPVEYGLLFERFTDPDRSEYPDIDIDICQDGRQAIIEYVRQKYGYVAQIITFGTLKARAAIRDVGRVLNVPLPEVDKLCKLVGDGLGTTIDMALKQEPDLKALYDQHPIYRELIDTARRLEGMSRHAGVHAAGVVLATQPLDNIVPLYRQGSDETLPTVTQWDGPTCEKVGLLKLDFLGLRTLSVIERAKSLIRKTLSEKTIRQAVGMADGGSRIADGKAAPPTAPPSAPHAAGRHPSAIHHPPSAIDSDPLDLERLAYDDQAVLDLFRRGETAGVFQFESGGMRNLLMAMKPDRLEDLIAANALFRPGPMDLIPDYNDRKHSRQSVPKVHPIVDQFTDETYGIMIYQEQVMQIVHSLGGIPLRAAYSLIKAISKKKQKDIDAVRPKFIEGAHEQGLPRQQAEELFELIMKFAGYGFNKSHSTGYAIVAYQTAYLKTYFPLHYMAALLTYESVSTEKVVQYVDECKRVRLPNGSRGIDVQPPDINRSEIGFTVVYEPGEKPTPASGHIRFGLNAVKGVGDKAILAIIQARNESGRFQSLYDFCERVPLSAVNRATIEALIKCGAFDDLHGRERRSAMLAALDAAIQAGQRAAADRDAGQMSFFDAFGQDADPTPGQTAQSPGDTTLPTVEPWSQNETLAHEKSVLGFYVSSHPLDQHHDTLDRFTNVCMADIRNLAAEINVTIGGMLTRVRHTMVKNGRSAGAKMAMLTIEDRTGAIDAVVFSKTYAIASPLLQPDGIVLLRGKIDRRREEPCVIVEEVIPVEQAAERMTEAVRIVLHPPAPSTPANPTGLPSHAAPPALPASTRPSANGNHIAAADQHGREHRSPHRHGNPAATLSLLRDLQTLLRQQSRGGGTAAVLLEVHQDGHVVDLRLDNMRIGVDRDLPARIDTVLQRPGSCQLLGPARLMNNGHTDRNLLHNDAGPQQPRLAPRTGAACASIDRY